MSPAPATTRARGDRVSGGDWNNRAARPRNDLEDPEARWVELPDDLYGAMLARLPAREDRDTDAPLFPGVTADRLRTALGRACKAAGVPGFSPHGLRHRRISLLHRQGESWAEIG